MAIILSYMASAGKKISELVATIPTYYVQKEKIACQSAETADELIDKVKEHFRRNNLVLTEGVKVIFPTGWVHVRPSNTEPIIRIIAECREKEEAARLISEVMNLAQC
jgi:phosphomannomutase